VQGRPVPGRDGAAGKDGAPGKGFDSSLLDVLDRRVSDLERIVGALGTTVDDLLGLLCRPALARLLNLLNICL
jgi:hypothetical protein